MSRARVLVVDDDADIRKSLQRGLALAGFDVDTVGDGADADEQLRTDRPDAVVSRRPDVPAGRRTASVDGLPLELTRREFDLLEVLARNGGLVLSRSRLLELVWGYDFDVRTDVVDTSVSYLRRKFEDGGRPRLIHTVRGCRIRVARTDRRAPTMRLWRTRLSTRLAVVVAVLVAVAVLSAGTVLMRVAERDLLAAQDAQLRAAARVVAPFAERLRERPGSSGRWCCRAAGRSVADSSAARTAETASS